MESAFAGAGQGAAAGASAGPWGAVIGAAVGGTFGFLSGQSASRAKKWQRIANQRQAEYGALQNRRNLLQSIRSMRSQRAAQIQAGSEDLLSVMSGQEGAVAGIGSQYGSAYTMFDRDLWYQDYIQSALNKAGAAGSKATQYSNFLNFGTNLVGAGASLYNADRYNEEADKLYALAREYMGKQEQAIRYTNV